MGRMRFAGLSRVTHDAIVVQFSLPEPLEHARVERIEQYARTWYGHLVRLKNRGRPRRGIGRMALRVVPADRPAGAVQVALRTTLSVRKGAPTAMPFPGGARERRSGSRWQHRPPRGKSCQRLRLR